LNGGISCSCPKTSRGFSSVSLAMSGYKIESKLRARYAEWKIQKNRQNVS
jgi:hypothetical protein